jgi:hypothetical protein
VKAERSRARVSGKLHRLVRVELATGGNFAKAPEMT